MENDILQRAEKFLKPVLKVETFTPARASSVVDKIFDGLQVDLPTSETKNDFIVHQALVLLEQINESLGANEAQSMQVLNTVGPRRIIDALLDLISLEGIYPSLLPGVGSPIERRVRSVIQGGITITDMKDGRSPDSTHLARIVERLHQILISGHAVSQAIIDRTLVDVIAAMAQLGYAPEMDTKSAWPTTLQQLLDSLSPSILFPSLISLLHPSTPDWLRPRIAIPLSLLPMRSDGVRATITFVAKSTPQRPGPKAEQSKDLAANGPVLLLEVLEQVSKVLSAVPSTVKPDVYLSAVAPQLVALLEDKDPDARRAAAYTISHGILSKRQLGQPGSPGWRLFIEPLIQTLEPSSGTPSDSTKSVGSINQALKHMSTLLLTFSNPGLSRRLIRPVLLTIWGIAGVTTASSEDFNLAMQLLRHYMTSVAGSNALLEIVDDLMYGATWIVTREPELRIKEAGTTSMSQTITLIDQIPNRSHLLMQLIKDCKDDKISGQFFAGVLGKAFASPADDGLGATSTRSLLQPMIYATITQEMIKVNSVGLSADPNIIYPVIDEVLRTQITARYQSSRSRQAYVSLSNMASIIRNTEDDSRAERSDHLEAAISICLPWLIMVMNDERIDAPKLSTEQIDTLKSLIQRASDAPGLSLDVKQQIRLSLALLADSWHGNTSSITADQDKIDAERYVEAMKNLQAQEPPLRAQGLSQLANLLRLGSPLVSSASVSLTVLSLLQDSDSFVYLSAVKTLVSLARNEPVTVLKTLGEAYHDVTEQSTVDVRLRIGEAIQTIIEEIGKSLPDTTVTGLVDMLLYVASRRVYRPKAHESQIKAEKIPRQAEPEQERDEEDDEDLDEEYTKPQRDLQAILDTWSGRKGAEDLRIRTSALTILGTILEQISTVLGSSAVPISLEIADKILRNEKGQENAIVRRAAVMLILSLLKGLESARDDVKALKMGSVDTKISLDTMDELLQLLMVEDDDDIVRGHAEDTLQAVAAWKQETFDRMLRGDNIRFGLEDEHGNIQLQGLDIDPDASQRAVSNLTKPRIEEVE